MPGFYIRDSHLIGQVYTLRTGKVKRDPGDSNVTTAPKNAIVLRATNRIG